MKLNLLLAINAAYITLIAALTVLKRSQRGTLLQQ